jgi:hypothetical protein
VIIKPSFPLQWKCSRDSSLHSSVRPDVIKWTALLIRSKFWYQNEYISSLMRGVELKLSFPFQAWCERNWGPLFWRTMGELLMRFMCLVIVMRRISSTIPKIFWNILLKKWYVVS